jgi:hypothetical protein
MNWVDGGVVWYGGVGGCVSGMRGMLEAWRVINAADFV